MRLSSTFGAAFIVSRCLLAQPAPSFEVASIKLSTPQELNIGMYAYPGGRLTVTNYTLKDLIHEAYGLQSFQIDGGPRWAGEDRYSIVAKPPADSQSSKINPRNPKLPPPEEELQMLRTLLAERFHLVVREETKEGPIYALVVGSGGAKLNQPKDKEAYPVVSYGRTGVAELPDFMLAENATMALFAARLSAELSRPVLDQTGLTGAYDFKFKYVKRPAESAEGPTIFGAIQELGLKLVSTKGPVFRLVIDRAEKPTEN